MNERHPVWNTLKWVAVGLLVGVLLMVAYRLVGPAEPEGDIHGNVVMSPRRAS